VTLLWKSRNNKTATLAQLVERLIRNVLGRIRVTCFQSFPSASVG